MYYKLFENEIGDYLDTNKKCVNIMEAESVLCPDGSPEENGWIVKDNLAEAMEFWGLTRIGNG